MVHKTPASMVEVLVLVSHLTVSPLLRVNAAALLAANLQTEPQVEKFCEPPQREEASPSAAL